MLKLNKKTLVTAITFLLIGIISTSVYWVFAQSATPFTISEGVYPSSNSFTISREVLTYYAKNSYGQIAFSGTNATAVVTNAQNTFGSDGGIIHFKGQTTYEFSVTLQLRRYVIYEGEGEGTILYRSGNFHTLNFSGGTDDWLTIRDLHFSGFGQSEAIIWIQGGAEVNIYNNYLTSGASGADGIVIEGTLTSWIHHNKLFYLNNGIVIKNWVGVNPSYAIHIYNNDITQSYASGILIEQGNQYGIDIYRNTIQFSGVAEIFVNGSVRHLTLDTNYHESDANIPAVDIQSAFGLSSGIVIINNDYAGTAGDASINVGLTGGAYEVHGALITGNTFAGTIINVTEMAYDTRITYNSFDTSYSPTNYGTRTVWEGNHGFITENSGTEANCASLTWVAHGLAGIPTATLLSSDTNVQVYLNNANATHIRIGVASGNPYVYWYVEYNP